MAIDQRTGDFTLPNPSGYGFLGNAPLPSEDLSSLQAPIDPTQLQTQLSKMDTPITIPDFVRVRYGAGDPKIVNSLLAEAAGNQSGLVGVGPDQARQLLESWGYPTTINGWNAAQWQQAIGAHAGDPNPVALMESLYQ